MIEYYALCCGEIFSAALFGRFSFQMKMLSLPLLSFLLQFFFYSGHAYTNEALADQVTNLPGAEGLDITFNQFSGYLSIPGINGENTKFMHYW